MTGDDGLIGALGHAVIATDLAGTVTQWNAAAERLYGWSAGEALGQPVQSLVVPEAMLDFADEIMAELERGRSWSGAFTVRRKDGSTFLALVTDSAIRSREGTLVGILGVSFDLGAAVAPFLLRSHEASVVTDTDGWIRLVSPAVHGLLGWQPADLVGKLWWDFVHEDDRSTAQAVHAAATRTGELVAPVEQRVLRADGTFLWVDASKTNLLDEPAVRGILVTLRNVTERRERTEDLTRRALHDSLTGLLNREAFMGHLEAHVARRQHAGAVLFLDLDRFKRINDRHGHAAGDHVLAVVAARLRETVRPEDVCSRLGGDEFAVLSPGLADPLQAIAFAQRIRARVSEPVPFGGHLLPVQVSVGVTLLNATSNADQALRLADHEMYAHKHHQH